MSEHVIFYADASPDEVGVVTIQDAWEASVPVPSVVAEDLGRSMLHGVDKPVTVRAGHDGMPGREPQAVPSTNTRYFTVV